MEELEKRIEESERTIEALRRVSRSRKSA